jgi:hypothetical protein|nr:MAG TPA: putative periplasmic lipoprotein [Bacteriophage sp.]
METIKNWINNIISLIKGNDKLKHVIINFAIVLIVGVFNLKVGVALAIVASISKELYDKFRSNGTGWDWKDIIADLIGIILGILIIIL